MGVKISNRVKLKICIGVMIFFNLLILYSISNYNKNTLTDLSVNTLHIFNDRVSPASTELQGINIGRVTTHGESNLNGYSTHLNDAVGMGATITTITGTINSTVLSNYDIIVLDGGGSSWSASELNALSSWVSNGGGLYLLGDQCGSAQVSVSNKFSVYYVANQPSGGAIINIFHPLFNGVSSWGFNWPNGHIDLSTSNPSYTNIHRYDSDGIIIVLEFGNGRILWNVVDMIANTKISENDNRVFGKNSWKWLAQYEPPPPPPPPDPSPSPFNPAHLLPFLILGSADNSMSYIIPIIIVGVIVFSSVIAYVSKVRNRKKYNYYKSKPRKRLKKEVKTLTCPRCHAPISRRQAKQLKHNELVICEYCGGSFN